MLGMVALVVVLFIVGWYVYPPVYDLLTGQTPASSQAEPSQPEPSQSAAEPPASSSEPELPEQPVAPGLTEVRAVYAPAGLMRDSARLEELARSASAAGCNAVLFDGKDDTGRVLFRTANEIAMAAEAVDPAAVDLEQVAALLARYQMKPAVRLHVYQDHLAPAADSDMAVKYNGQDLTWLDNYANQGGRPWLNPYSKAAQDYNIALALECAQKGAALVVADSVQFPNTIGKELATYGDTGGKSRAQVLGEFVQRLDQALAGEQSRLAVATPGTVLLGQEGFDYLGEPGAYQCAIAVNIMPSFFAKQPSSSALAPVMNPGDTVTTAVQGINESGAKALIPYVQAYTDADIPADKNKQYTKEDIQAQIDALAALEVEEYILYSPQGTYPW